MTIASQRQGASELNAPPQPTKRVGIPKEIFPGECRVAATPETAKILCDYGFAVTLEAGAGEAANFHDADYEAVGCQIAPNPQALWSESDIVLKVRPPATDEAEQLPAGNTLISFIWANQHPELVQKLTEKQATVLAMETVPRISRAQKLDALSSMANIAGYRAVIEAANHFGRFFTGQITAAGKIPPAKVLVIGAGVAGLAAIGTAKGLGAIVRAFDTRPAVKEQVESLGAEFLQVEIEEDGSGQGGYAKVMSPEFIAAEMALFAEQAKDVDIIITTALIPGRPAPKLITQSMVESMKPGSVVVDLAAEQGGNCEVTEPGRCHRHGNVTIIGFTDLPSRMAAQASQLYGKNLCHILDDLGRNDDYHIDLNDEVVNGALLLYEGVKPEPLPPKPAPTVVPTATTEAAVKIALEQVQGVSSDDQVTQTTSLKASLQQVLGQDWLKSAIALSGLVALLAVGSIMPSSFLSHFTVFVLACFVGWQVIWNVKPALHTPLMSVTNAISGIIILGGMLQVSGQLTAPTTLLGAFAILIGTVNIVGGFLVTQRMLKMFQK
ncbi:Re/Si-specific NAD(P)(+) transhydrogenase subunit alpha [filamentous cyanobacterium LEGE 11480]|uniref:NAD(P) transhydrogenase subunit alpha n=1 Tax=Romeriopsis navalis LEGE 11480 TaxID=2777977 RepID=A0A928Z1I5_9CYAN|nr:Re/Si-specific NAD(P)(+) transhydrogenase subunit alpha [Romeriopsis navalis]MBE9029386.1 Re/Si-specific NAD(P)(+) transhydrogenase subunit alpha [Romeriopsis navalis LEGE 11480]